MSNLMFEREDVLKETHPLGRILRLLFYKMRITHDDYIRMHAEFFSRWNFPPEKRNHDMHNLRRWLSGKIKDASGNEHDLPTYSFQRTMKVIADVLNLPVVRWSVTLRDREGNEFTLNSDDIPDAPEPLPKTQRIETSKPMPDFDAYRQNGGPRFEPGEI